MRHRRIHRQRAVHEGEDVVGGGQRTLGHENVPGTHWRTRWRVGAEIRSATQHTLIVAVHKATIGSREHRQTVAFRGRLVIRCHRQRRRVNGKSVLYRRGRQPLECQDWSASTVTEPAPRMLKTLLLTVAGPETTL